MDRVLPSYRQASPQEILDSQEHFDNHFLDSPIWREACSADARGTEGTPLTAGTYSEAVMKRELGPAWSATDRKEGERLHKAWEDHFSGTGSGTPDPASALDPGARVAQAQRSHEGELLRYPNVVGVSEGVRLRDGKPTGERCLVVYVQNKVPRDRLGKDEVLPSQVDGIPVDVVEVGSIEPLPAPKQSK
jgi:hypothetical protein